MGHMEKEKKGKKKKEETFDWGLQQLIDDSSLTQMNILNHMVGNNPVYNTRMGKYYFEEGRIDHDLVYFLSSL